MGTENEQSILLIHCCEIFQKVLPRFPGIISAKNVTDQHGFQPTTSCLPGRRTTKCAMVTRISKLVFTKWGNKWNNEVEIWQNLGKKRNTDYDFYPPLNVGGKY